MKDFFRTIGNSISSLDFYQKLGNQPFADSAKFYALFLVLAVVARLAIIYLHTIPTFSAGVTTSLQELQKHYPKGLTLQWDGTQLVSSQNPVYIYYPKPLAQFVQDAQFPQFLGYISTNPETTIPHLDAFLTVTRTELLIPNSNDEVGKIPLVDVLGANTYDVTENTPAQVSSFWENNKQRYFTLFGFILPFGLYVYLAVQRVFLLLVEGLLFYLFKKISGMPWSYATSVKYAMHVFVPAEIIDMVARFVYPTATISFFSLTVWLYFIALLFFPAAVIVMKRRQQ
jgi:hypothetical protein